MKIKTLFIAPYPAMTNLIEECSQEEHKLDIEIEVANLQEAIPVAREAEKQGYDVIISRGGTSKLIENEVTIPVIDINVSGYDMLRVLTLANDFPGKKAIVGFSNITLGAKAITDLLEIQIDVFTVEKAKEVDSLVEKLNVEGYELIMGDVITTDAATKHNVKSILIQSGREAIFEVFQKAKSIYRMHQRQQQEIHLLRSLLADEAKDMIVLTEQGQVIFEQWGSLKISPVSTSKLMEQIQKNQQDDDVCIIKTFRQQKIKQIMKIKEIDEQVYYVFTFSKVAQERLEQGLHIETISQQPTLISTSKSMERCVSLIDNSLRNDQWLLIGEDGTGKKLLSQYIHFRKHKESGFFASTSAMKLLKMHDEMDPNICTLYINEIEGLPSTDIKKLSSKIENLVGKNITLILALSKEQHEFHSLIYHQDLIRVAIPSLSDRKDDIRPLVTFFIAAFHGQLGTSAIKMKEEAMELLEQYSWPSNVAQLKALIKSAVLEEKGYVIGKKLIQHLLGENNSNVIPSVEKEFLVGTLDEIERRIIEQIMLEENHNQTRVAERLGINRSTLWRKLKQ